MCVCIYIFFTICQTNLNCLESYGSREIKLKLLGKRQPCGIVTKLQRTHIRVARDDVHHACSDLGLEWVNNAVNLSIPCILGYMMDLGSQEIGISPNTGKERLSCSSCLVRD